MLDKAADFAVPMEPEIPTRALLEVRDLVLQYKTWEHLVTATWNVNFDVHGGDRFVLLGPSGCGNSSILNAVGGFLPPGSGAITLEGRRVTGPGPDRLMVFQEFEQLLPWKTVRENVMFPMREYLDVSDRLRADVASVKLAMVGLSKVDGEKYPADLSGGMTKRAALARALALDPEIVFLDEPNSGLEPSSAGEFDALIRTLQQTLGLTVFMVTHDLDSLYAVCDRIAVLADGKVVALGTIEEILASDHPWVRAYFRGKRRRLAPAEADTASS